MSDPKNKDIAALAYLIWEQQGRPENRSEEHWIEAEYQVLAKSLVYEKGKDHDDNDLRSRGLGSC